MKIGILLPTDFDLGLLRRARRLSILIGQCAAEDGRSWSTAIGVPESSERRWRAIERDLREGNPRAVVRHLRWESISVAHARRMFANFPETLDLEGIEEIVVPRDWGWNFQDCDAAIIFADPALGAVLPLVPTVNYCRDLAVRIVPEEFASSIDDPYWQRQTEAFRLWRQSRVWTSDLDTTDDIVSYAGVRRGRVSLAPSLLVADGSPPGPSNRDQSALAWLMSPSPVHDLENSARGLETYLSEGGRLKPVLVRDVVRDSSGGGRAYPYGLPENLADLIYGLPSREVRSEMELLRLCGRSGAIWSSRLAGGEGEAPLLAAQCGVPFLGVDFGTNRAALDGTEIAAKFYRLDDPLAVADALHELETLTSGAPKPAKRTRDARMAKELASLIQGLLEPGIDS
jgi:hypothetical protein